MKIYLLLTLIFTIQLQAQTPCSLLFETDHFFRSERMAENIIDYLTLNDIQVAIIARRGPKNSMPWSHDEMGAFDAGAYTGLAHVGYVVNIAGPGDPPNYITINLEARDFPETVGRFKGRTLSDLVAYDLNTFTIGAFEKDIGLFVPPFEMQIKLLTELSPANGNLRFEPREQMFWGVRRIINYIHFYGDEPSFFKIFHRELYNYVSSVQDIESQNCIELALLLYLGIKLESESVEEIYEYIQANFKGTSVSTFSWFTRFLARMVSKQIYFGEVVDEAHQIPTVEALVENREVLGLDMMFFREMYRVGPDGTIKWRIFRVDRPENHQPGSEWND